VVAENGKLQIIIMINVSHLGNEVPGSKKMIIIIIIMSLI